LKLLDLILKLHSIKAVCDDIPFYVYDSGFDDGFKIKNIDVVNNDGQLEGYFVI